MANGHADTRRMIRARQEAKHNRNLAVMVIVLLILASGALLIVAPDMNWLDVFGKVAARGLQELAK